MSVLAMLLFLLTALPFIIIVILVVPFITQPLPLDIRAGNNGDETKEMCACNHLLTALRVWWSKRLKQLAKIRLGNIL